MAILLAIPAAHAATLTTLVSFNGANGYQPKADLIADAAGNLYGTTSRGGESNRGTVFKLNTTSGALTTLVSFDGANGRYPAAGLVFDAAGNLYGTTREGGATGYGTVFKVDPAAGSITTLMSFTGIDGGAPMSQLIADIDGNLYGTTSLGGTRNPGLAGNDPVGSGTVFQFSTTSNVLKTLTTFINSREGYLGGGYPQAGLTSDSSGNLYGTTTIGGTKNKGTIFKLHPTTAALETIVSFDGANGNRPNSTLIVDSAGKLYGTAVGLYDNLGTVFALDPVTGVLTTLATFTGANGSKPTAGLLADAAGNLYGMTEGGGDTNRGTIFRLDAITGALTILFSFDGVRGSHPSSRLIADAAGNLYGTTWSGGGGYGTIFKVTDAGFVVPEPTSVALVLFAGIAVAGATRRTEPSLNSSKN